VGRPGPDDDSLILSFESNALKILSQSVSARGPPKQAMAEPASFEGSPEHSRAVRKRAAVRAAHSSSNRSKRIQPTHLGLRDGAPPRSARVQHSRGDP
jgi:hypothetical protein